jgi:ABC-type protease/lipase transport system fused ATPase/permease subunit
LNAKAAFIRLTALISEHYSAPIQGHNKSPPTGSVKLENVFASPPNSQPQVVPTLKNINLTLEPGKIVTLVGPSGSGKTSLVRVLLGIWPSISGNVFWGADRYESWSAEELGCHVGYLPQDVQIFDGSIAQNIARQGELTPGKVIEAAKSANLHDAILRLPQGYDTRIGVGGIPLSGGQRQRLGLARALHGNPSLIVLDEPNANLDDVGEKALAGALAQAKLRGAAILVISHRPQLMAVSDQVIRIADGMLLPPQAHAV